MKTFMVAVLIVGSLPALGGEIADYHRKHVSVNLGDQGKSTRVYKVFNHGITAIGIERTGCFGDCPVFTFIVKNDGTFRYKGVKFVEHKGVFTGKIPAWRFHYLAQFIKNSGYMELEDEYTPRNPDSGRTYTMVLMNGRKKTIENNAGEGPIKLWAIEQLIDDMLEKLVDDSYLEVEGEGSKKAVQ